MPAALRHLPIFALFATACAGPGASASTPPSALLFTGGELVVLPVADVEWGPLNPARGDASPRAATLWGDRNAAGATGFLVRFVDGFESPPHIHNVSYRGVVIHGRVHNDHPDAEALWMGTGSYWTQPLGAVHITAASGEETVAYIEIDEGPYLVRPVEDAHASEEEAINVPAEALAWRERDGVELASLWGDPSGEEARGLLLRLPAASTTELESLTSSFRVVVIEGSVEHHREAAADGTSLAPGSSIDAAGSAAQLTCRAEVDCTLYVRAEGNFNLRSLD